MDTLIQIKDFSAFIKSLENEYKDIKFSISPSLTNIRVIIHYSSDESIYRTFNWDYQLAFTKTGQEWIASRLEDELNEYSRKRQFISDIKNLLE